MSFDMSIEELIFKKKFKDEDFNPDSYIDWVADNPKDAYNLAVQVHNSEIHRWRMKYDAIATGYEEKIKDLVNIIYSKDREISNIQSLLDQQ